MKLRSIINRLASRHILGLPAPIFFTAVSLFLVHTIILNSLWHDVPVLTNDSHAYLDVAEDLKDFRLDNLYNRTPGYPLLLLISGSTPEPDQSLFNLQLMLHFISVYLILILLHRMNVKQSLIYVFLFIGLLPMYSERAAYVLTENFTMFLLVMGLVGLIFWLQNGGVHWLLLSGFTMALSGITRPTYQILSVLVVLILFVLTVLPALYQSRKRTWMAIGVISGFAVFIIGGTIFYNYQHFNFAGLTPLSGFNLNGKTARFVERLPDEYAEVREVLIKHRDAGLIKPNSAHTGAGYIWEPETQAELQEITGMNQVELSKYMSKLNLLLIRSAPLEYLTEVGYAFVTYWFPANGRVANMDSRVLQLLWGVIHVLVMIFFAGQSVLLGSVGILMVNLSHAKHTSLLGNVPDLSIRFNTFVYSYMVIFLTAAVSTVIQSGDVRFRIPTDLLILLVMFVGIDTLWYLRRQFRECVPG